MDKLNKHLLENLKEINKCVIHYGEYLVNSGDIVFDKKISKNRFDSIINQFTSNKYTVNKKIIYNHKNSFCDINIKYAYKKVKCSNFETDYKNILVELYNEVDIGYSNFTCKREYHNVYEYESTKIELCPEIYLNFIQQGNYYTFSIEINVDHNIDNTIIKLNKILGLL
jgi:hypothetical protein